MNKNTRIAELVSKAVSLHQAGNLDEAEALCRTILAQDSKQFAALTLLGTLHLQRGNPEEAARLIGLSVAIEPKQPGALNNRGLALDGLKRYPEALASYERAIALNPGFAEAHSNRGVTLGRLKRYGEALASFDRAIALNPRFGDAHSNRGSLLNRLARHDEALASFDRAIALDPGRAESHYNRGVALAELKRIDAALASYERAIALNPGHADAYNNRGIVLVELDRIDAALASYGRAIALNPRLAGAYNNAGVAFAMLNRHDEAISCYDRAIALDPGHADAHLNKGYLKILLGQYAEGWRLFEWRWRHEDKTKSPQNFPRPLWLGQEDPTGKTMLLHPEQGIGDSIQFCRFAPMVEALGAKVILQTHRSLAALLGSLKDSIRVIPLGEPLPEFDYHCPLMSLPLALATEVDAIPAEVPYLKPDESKRSQWQTRLGPRALPRVGLVWSGGQAHSNDRNRSMPLENLLPVLGPDFEFHCLQKEIRATDRAVLDMRPDLKVHVDDLGDFSDTAALVAEMDLVISVDTSVAHLAGALGKPVWILLPFAPDYRWMLARDDSPWYPTARLFRQPQRHDWASVIDKVAAQLQALNRAGDNTAVG